MKSTLLKSILVVSAIITVFYLGGCKCCSKKSAEKMAIDSTASVCKSKCDMVPDPGTCKAMIPKYYFDKKEGKCKEFSWGGCLGVVPFQTLDECEKCGCGKK